MSAPTAKAPWGLRFSIRFLSVLLGLLCYWLLGFVMRDIATTRGPDWETVEAEFVDAAKVAEARTLERQIGDLRRKLKNEQTNRGNIEKDSASHENTMSRLLAMLEKRQNLSPQEQEAFDKATAYFLAKKQQISVLNESIQKMTLREQELQAASQALELELARQRQPARGEWEKRRQAHRIKVAICKLAVLIPLLLISALLLARRRGTPYAPVYWAPAVATALMVMAVMNEHFPARVFKYVLMAICLGLVLRVLVAIIRKITKPPKDWLQKQYREAYERFLCPVCEFPIRRGPLRFVYWTRRRVKHLLRPESGDAPTDEPYTCPACATTLFDSCPSCKGVRHTLLPACDHCGQANELETESAEGA
jgi:uncharacterized protein YfkK (UPF0435 family)